MTREIGEFRPSQHRNRRRTIPPGWLDCGSPQRGGIGLRRSAAWGGEHETKESRNGVTSRRAVMGETFRLARLRVPWS